MTYFKHPCKKKSPQILCCLLSGRKTWALIHGNYTCSPVFTVLRHRSHMVLTESSHGRGRVGVNLQYPRGGTQRLPGWRGLPKARGCWSLGKGELWVGSCPAALPQGGFMGRWQGKGFWTLTSSLAWRKLECSAIWINLDITELNSISLKWKELLQCIRH